MEVWINGYENRYKVSTEGKILYFKNGLFLEKKLEKTNRGYLSVSLFNKTRKTYYVHRIVAAHFIPNPENKPEVNHDDRNRTNNHVDNLIWATGEENRRHAHAFHSNITDEIVRKIRNEKGKTQRELALKYCVGKSTIGGILTGKTWSHLPKTNYDRSKPKFDYSKREGIQKMILEGFSQSVIAKEFSVSPSFVSTTWRKMKKNNH